ncbi:PREDICTED: pyridine nucleotide-disulfide oxidoreductase domain-containing protein 2 isoform X2 [Nelumbo nucifera]|uniref:Pyridine nucleotide-disulfide oxidoreductase domain-containing protein 2 n=1 Tax=Nelumbo nucifera TaxID=4432 RepID=A0A1U7ZZY3_NELNU|nr:PREDICTED: pyridine nucleotide-disulfide oxidoreductase domain-containing protein 2 isoform X2 [Nelumbo nucifera]XP_010254833.1 PREDICTED: pyridine nucleotide-disulfide oxidoreductase domain-containing protein 2 isoform X2 [Nelumbo nucifera]
MWRRIFSTSTSTSTSAPAAFTSKGKKWDALIIGGGHNGLTAAAYLARSGLSVAVLERRHLIGGAAVTEELVPGFKFSRCSYLQSLLRPSVIRELELGRHGLKLLKRNPSSFTPCLDGRYLLLGPDAELNHSEISKFSKQDAEAYPRYENQLQRFCSFMDYLLDSPTPEVSHKVLSFTDRMRDKLQKSIFWAHCFRRAIFLWQKDMVDFMDLLLSPASKVLNNWFETDVLKATLATDAVIGTMGTVHTPGSGYVLLHHVMGETDGDRGIWSYVEGGMGAVSSAISNAAREAGAHIVTNAEVAQLMINDDSGAVKGVVLADGTEVHSSVVLSNATPYRTFMELVPQSVLPEEFRCAISNLDYSSGTTKINIAVDRLPQFQCCNPSIQEAGPQHVGTIHIGSESMEEIDLSYRDALSGFPSQRPLIEMTIPSVLDKTISPPGKHVINLFVQYTPYRPSVGSWEDLAFRESFAQRCFSLIDEYAPGFSSSVIDYDMLTPVDLEREFGLTEVAQVPFQWVDPHLSSSQASQLWWREHISWCNGLGFTLLNAAC